MTPTDFLPLLEEVLRQRRLPFSRAAAIVFVEACWELIDDDPGVWYWSKRFVETNGTVSTAGIEVGKLRRLLQVPRDGESGSDRAQQQDRHRDGGCRINNAGARLRFLSGVAV